MIFILGIDGLEYDFIKKWNLKNLMQLEYGKIKVPINEKQGIPMSPDVWASFLAGKNVSMAFTTSNHLKPVLWLLRTLKIDYSEGFFKKCKNFGKKLGLNFKPRIGGLKQKTFLDMTNSIEINVPYYSFDHATLDTLYLFGEEELSLNKTIEEIKHIYENRKKQILNELDKIDNQEIIFSFIHTTDSLQHLSFNHIIEIKKYYVDLDNYFLFLKKKLYEKFDLPIILIISDHGFDIKTKDHSKYAFYSSNIIINPKPIKITDFYEIIMIYAHLEK